MSTVESRFNPMNSFASQSSCALLPRTRQLLKNYNRRIGVALSLLVGVFVFASCASAPVPELRPSSESIQDAPDRLIDVHMHVDFDGKPDSVSGIVSSREALVAEMKEANVVAGVALESRTGSSNAADLAGLPIIRCAGISKKVDTRKVENGLRNGTYNCIKIYLGYIYKYASDPSYQPLYKLAEKYDVPVVFHTGDTIDPDGKLKYADPLTIDEIAIEHRKVNFVIAHCGNPWIQSAAEVAYKNANVYLDGSAFMIGKLKEKTPESLRKNIIEPVSWIFQYTEGSEKLMFGTDWPLVRIKDYRDVFKQAIPKESWAAVFHDNAVKVFKLDRALKSQASKK